MTDDDTRGTAQREAVRPREDARFGMRANNAASARPSAFRDARATMATFPTRARSIGHIMPSIGRVASSHLSAGIEVHVMEVARCELIIEEPADGDLIILHVIRGSVWSASQREEQKGDAHVLLPGERWRIRMHDARVTLTVISLLELADEPPAGSFFRTGLVEALGALCIVAVRRPFSDQDSRTALARCVRDLARSIVSHAAIEQPGSSRGDLYRDARRVIVERRTDPMLSVETLAGALCVTPRHLQRAFRARGTSPAREIRRQRVALAESLFSRGELARLVDVARASGFRSVATMRRAFDGMGKPLPTIDNLGAAIRRPRGYDRG